MKNAKYPLTSIDKYTIFEFISEGPNWAIKKIIQFQETNEPNLYNLAFRNKIQNTDEIDDLAISNNGDTEKILSTVAAALYVFLENYSESYVYATGSTKSRTRLYRFGISKFIEEIRLDFIIYGQISDDFFIFELNKEYDGFLVKNKK